MPEKGIPLPKCVQDDSVECPHSYIIFDGDGYTPRSREIDEKAQCLHCILYQILQCMKKQQ